MGEVFFIGVDYREEPPVDIRGKRLVGSGKELLKYPLKFVTFEIELHSPHVVPQLSHMSEKNTGILSRLSNAFRQQIPTSKPNF